MEMVSSRGVGWFSGQPTEPEFLDVSQPTTFPTNLLADNSRHKIEIYPNNFDLIIHDVSNHDAGLYTCRLVLKGTNSSAYLVLMQQFSCGSGRPVSDITSRSVAEGDTVPLVCSVQSYGQVAPTLKWTSDTGSISSLYTVEGEKVTISTEMTATVELHQKPFTCHLSFEDDGNQTSESATYSESCVFSYKVSYGPRYTQFSPDATSADGILRLMPGDNVSCSSSGNPAPNYEWVSTNFAEGAGIIIHQPVLGITADMISSVPVTWRCRASNYVNGIFKTDYTAAVDILVSNQSSTKLPLTQPPRTTTRPSPQPTPPPTSAASSTAESLPNNNAQAQTDGGNGAVIGGAVAGVVVVIILLAAAAYFFNSRRKVKDADKKGLMTDGNPS